MQPLMNNEEYHSSPEISKSDLDAAAKSGVHFLHKKEGPKSKPTPAMRIGSAFHALILEPDVFENEFIYKPEILNARSKDCLLYTSPSPRDRTRSRMPSSA